MMHTFNFPFLNMLSEIIQSYVLNSVYKTDRSLSVGVLIIFKIITRHKRVYFNHIGQV